MQEKGRLPLDQRILDSLTSGRLSPGEILPKVTGPNTFSSETQIRDRLYLLREDKLVSREEVWKLTPKGEDLVRREKQARIAPPPPPPGVVRRPVERVAPPSIISPRRDSSRPPSNVTSRPAPLVRPNEAPRSKSEPKNKNERRRLGLEDLKVIRNELPEE